MSEKARKIGLAHYWLSAGLILLFALSVHLYQIHILAEDPTVKGPIIDSLVYHREALRIIQSQAPPQTPHWQSPLFPWVLSVVYRISRPDPGNGLYLQAGFHGLIAVQVFVIARFFLNPTLAFFVGLLACLHGPLLFFCGQLIPAPMATFLALLAVLAAIWSGRSSRLAASGLAGLVLGFAIAARGNVAPFLAWLVARPFLSGYSVKRAIIIALLAVTGTSLGILPVGISNYLRSGSFDLSTSNLGVNLYIGNNQNMAETTGIRPGYQWDDLLAEPSRNGHFSAFDQSEYFTDKVVHWALNHPLGLGKALLLKIGDLAGGRETPRNMDPYGSLGTTRLTSLLLFDHGIRFPFGLVLPLSILGFLPLLRSRTGQASKESDSVDAIRTIFWFVVLNGVGIALFFPTGRYRLAMSLALIPVAVEGARNLRSHVLQSIQERNLSSLAPLAIAVASFGWANFAPPLTGPDMSQERNLQLGWAYVSSRSYAKAENVLTGEVGKRPANADAWRSLAEAREGLGDTSGAVEALKTAVSLAPEFGHAWQHLGAIQNANNHFESAKDSLEMAVKANPGHPLAWSDLSRAWLGLNDPTAAILAAKRAVEVNPDLGAAWLYLGIGRRKNKDFVGSEKALLRAIDLWPDHPRPRYHLAKVYAETDRREAALRLAELVVSRWPKYKAGVNFLRKLKAGNDE